ncbi:MAG: outer membrane lipoprotein carrier protein LolA [Salibacteraceae bacterium]
MSNPKLLTLLVGLCLCLPTVFAQSPEADWQRVMGTYQQLNAFSSQMEIAVYISHRESLPAFRMKASIQKSEHHFRYEVAGQTILFAPDFELMVNEELQEINFTARKLSRKAKKQQELWFLQSGGELPSLPDSVEYGVADASSFTLELATLNGPIQKTWIKVDRESYLVQEVTYLYRANDEGPGAKVVVSYQNVSANPSFEADTFSPNPYLIQKRKNIALTPAYADYTLQASISKH